MPQKLTQQEVENRYEKLGLKLLEPYIHQRLKHKTLCYCGNVFYARPNSIFEGAILSCGCYHRKVVTKHKLNENYFEKIDSEDKAYFLGFIFADGCVMERSAKSLRLSFQVNSRDHCILEKFAECLDSDYYIKKFSGKQYTGGFVSRLSIYNFKLCNDLIKHGCVPRKSLILKFPTTVPEHLLNHFIRGYFDGDGCISKDHFSIVGTEQFVIEIQKILIKECELNKTLLYFQSKVFYLQYGGSIICKKLFNYLYKNATIYLERKRERFEKINILKTKKSKYRGISFDTRNKSGNCFVRIDGKYIGSFSNEIDAAKAYNEAAIKLGKPESWLNKING